MIETLDALNYGASKQTETVLNALNAFVFCSQCSMCCVYQPVGFTSEEQLYCTDRGDLKPVDMCDGCTLGVQGKPLSGIVPPPMDVDLTDGLVIEYEE